MQEQDVLWVGIRPRMRIAGISKAGSSPIIISLWHEPAIANGDKVSVTGVKGNSAANQASAPVTYRPGTFWNLQRGLVRITVKDNQATVELRKPHGLVPGQVVEVYNSRDTVLGRIPWHNFYTVQETPGPNVFTFHTEGVPDGEYGVDPASNEHVGVLAFPALEIPGTSAGDYGGSGCSKQKLCDGGGLVTSIEDHKDFTEIPIFRFDPSKPVREQLLRYRDQ
jgi:hypothetical protein